MRHLFLLALLMLSTTACRVETTASTEKNTFYPADNQNIQYTGRGDFSDSQKPRFWAPGVYVTARFKGTSCDALITDELASENNHNYLQIIVDGYSSRIRLTGKSNTVSIARGLANTQHTVTICKDTESGIGYLEFMGLTCAQLLPPLPKPARKIEFIGNSITCGASSDLSVIPCGQGQWHDQHNAYMAYGPTTARALNAQWQLTAVSGIGLIRSCCNMSIVMPAVFDKVNLRENAIPWEFSRYQPDVVTICLGQNDGIQDSVKFCSAYVDFIKTVRQHYAKATIVCLTSPMGDAKLTKALKNYLTGIVAYATLHGEKNIQKFFFARSYTSGCAYHPSVAEQQLIAKELTASLQSILKW